MIMQAKKKAKKKAKFEVRPSSLGACTVATGDIAAAHLLYRVISRFQHFKPWVDSKGQKCVVLTRNEWMTDTGLTRHQYDRALRILKRDNWVRFRHAKMRKTDKYQRTWLYLPDTTVSAIAELMKANKGTLETDTATKIVSGDADLTQIEMSAGPDDKVNDNQKNNAEVKNNDYFENETETAVSEEAKKQKKEKESMQTKLIAQFREKRGPIVNNKKLLEEFTEFFAGNGFALPMVDDKTANDLRKCLTLLAAQEYRLINGEVLEEDVEEEFFTNTSFDLRAIQLIIWNWNEFALFLGLIGGAWSIPAVPGMTYIKLQIQNVVSYFHFKEWLYQHSLGHPAELFGVGIGNETNKLIAQFYKEGHGIETYLNEDGLRKKFELRNLQYPTKSLWPEEFAWG